MKAQIAKALQERCIATGAADEAHNRLLPTEVRDQVIDLMEAWWKLTQQPEAKLQYWSHEDKSAGVGLLHTPLDSEAIYAGEGYRQFSTNWSLRDVEPSVPIRMADYMQDLDGDE